MRCQTNTVYVSFPRHVFWRLWGCGVALRPLVPSSCAKNKLSIVVNGSLFFRMLSFSFSYSLLRAFCWSRLLAIVFYMMLDGGVVLRSLAPRGCEKK